MVRFTFFDGPYRNRTYDLRIMNVRYGSEALVIGPPLRGRAPCRIGARINQGEEHDLLRRTRCIPSLGQRLRHR
jgi:hypothetical protein